MFYIFGFYKFKRLTGLKKLKVLLIGETIIDQYVFGDVLGNLYIIFVKYTTTI